MVCPEGLDRRVSVSADLKEVLQSEMLLPLGGMGNPDRQERQEEDVSFLNHGFEQPYPGGMRKPGHS